MTNDRARAKAIVARLSAGSATPDEVFTAFEELDALPADVVREALEPWVGPAPDIERLDDATRRVHGLPPRPLRLRTLEETRDADVLELGDVAQEQLRIAGRSWDGADLEPEERLDGELEGSFAGTLVRRVLGDAESQKDAPIFDVMTFHGDAGAIFRAATADLVGLVADGRVEMPDRRARAAIQAALDGASAAAPPPKAPTKKKAAVAKPKQKAAAAAKPKKKAAAAAKPKKKAAAAAKPKKKAATAAKPKKKTAAAKPKKKG